MTRGHENIKEELRELAPNLARELGKDPFVLPEDYFEGKEKELCQIAMGERKIDSASKNEAFSLPQGYFESMADKVFTRLEMKKYRPLEQQKNIPVNYFDTLPNKVMTRIKSEETSSKGSGKVIRLSWPIATAIAAAFSGILIVLTLWMQPNPIAPSEQMSDLDKIPTDALEQYVENNIQIYGTDNLETFMNADEFDFSDAELSEEDLDTEELEEYLKEDIDLTTIEELL